MIKKILALIPLAVLLLAGCKEHEDIVWPHEVYIEPADTTITVGSSGILRPVFEPEEARLFNNRYFNTTWYSSDPNVVEVAPISGRVTGVSVGTATISVISDTNFKNEEGYWVTTIGSSCEVHVIDGKLNPQ